jgi:hypothetical protein
MFFSSKNDFSFADMHPFTVHINLRRFEIHLLIAHIKGSVVKRRHLLSYSNFPETIPAVQPYGNLGKEELYVLRGVRKLSFSPLSGEPPIALNFSKLRIQFTGRTPSLV